MAVTKDIDQLKRDKLADIIQRAIANPGNVDEVAEEIALDWFPMATVDPQGNISFIPGGDRKK